MLNLTAPALPRVVAYLSATLLVVASAGLGCVFAWTQGSQHGPLMGALSVAAAAGLDLAKALAVAGALAAARERHPGRALGLTLMAALAVAYSLTAELSLIAGARGDVVAERVARAAAANDARTRRERAEAELSALGPLRPSAEIRADIGGLLADPGVGDCSRIDGPRSRAACPVVAKLRAELGRAERRESLEQAAVALATPPVGAVNAADPGAAALATYLNALGITAAPGSLSEWLVLIPVLALEIGSALAIVLVRAVADPRPAGRVPETMPHVELSTAKRGSDTVARRESGPVHAVDTLDSEWRAAPAAVSIDRPAHEQPHGKQSGPSPAASKEAAAARIVDTLRGQGGRSAASIRGLAAAVGGKRSTVHGALANLIAAGAVARVGGELVLRG